MLDRLRPALELYAGTLPTLVGQAAPPTRTGRCTKQVCTDMRQALVRFGNRLSLAAGTTSGGFLSVGMLVWSVLLFITVLVAVATKKVQKD